jgi:hypothetical protein
MEDALIHDIKVLDKLLNSPLLLDKYPMINRVWVKKYGNNIDVVMSIDGPYNDFSPFRDEIRSFIWTIAKMAGVKSNFYIYP